MLIVYKGIREPFGVVFRIKFSADRQFSDSKLPNLVAAKTYKLF